MGGRETRFEDEEASRRSSSEERNGGGSEGKITVASVAAVGAPVLLHARCSMNAKAGADRRGPCRQ